jgi:hypothetical protein
MIVDYNSWINKCVLFWGGIESKLCEQKFDQKLLVFKSCKIDSRWYIHLPKVPILVYFEMPWYVIFYKFMGFWYCHGHLCILW